LRSLADELDEQFGVNVEVLVADLTDAADVGRVESRIAEVEPLDILVNNAGFGIPGEFAEIPVDRHVAMINVHVLSSVRFSRAALPGMLGPVVDQRGASAALATRTSLSARTTVQGSHTASSTHWNKPHHGWSGAAGARTRPTPASNRISTAMPVASA
jgi:short-subunit dehydrogenase